MKATWKDGARFALGSFDATTAQGKEFSMFDLRRSMKDSASEAEALIRFLLRFCILDLVAEESAEAGERYEL